MFGAFLCPTDDADHQTVLAGPGSPRRLVLQSDIQTILFSENVYHKTVRNFETGCSSDDKYESIYFL